MASTVEVQLFQNWEKAEEFQRLLIYITKACLENRPLRLHRFISEHLDCMLAKRTLKELQHKGWVGLLGESKLSSKRRQRMDQELQPKSRLPCYYFHKLKAKTDRQNMSRIQPIGNDKYYFKLKNYLTEPYPEQFNYQVIQPVSSTSPELNLSSVQPKDKQNELSKDISDSNYNILMRKAEILNVQENNSHARKNLLATTPDSFISFTHTPGRKLSEFFPDFDEETPIAIQDEKEHIQSEVKHLVYKGVADNNTYDSEASWAPPHHQENDLNRFSPSLASSPISPDLTQGTVDVKNSEQNVSIASTVGETSTPKYRRNPNDAVYTNLSNQSSFHENFSKIWKKMKSNIFREEIHSRSLSNDDHKSSNSIKSISADTTDGISYAAKGSKQMDENPLDMQDSLQTVVANSSRKLETQQQNYIFNGSQSSLVTDASSTDREGSLSSYNYPNNRKINKLNYKNELYDTVETTSDKGQKKYQVEVTICLDSQRNMWDVIPSSENFTDVTRITENSQQDEDVTEYTSEDSNSSLNTNDTNWHAIEAASANYIQALTHPFLNNSYKQNKEEYILLHLFKKAFKRLFRKLQNAKGEELNTEILSKQYASYYQELLTLNQPKLNLAPSDIDKHSQLFQIIAAASIAGCTLSQNFVNPSK